MCKPVIADTICGIPVASFSRKPTPGELASLFCAMSDDDMAEFFVAVDQIAETFEGTPGMQWWYTGRHLAMCPDGCGGSNVITEIYQAMTYKKGA